MIILVQPDLDQGQPSEPRWTEVLPDRGQLSVAAPKDTNDEEQGDKEREDRASRHLEVRAAQSRHVAVLLGQPDRPDR